MIDYICVGLVACYITYNVNKCSKKTETNNEPKKSFLKLL